jgi:hypothetical protein
MKRQRRPARRDGDDSGGRLMAKEGRGQKQKSKCLDATARSIPIGP